MKKHLQFHAIAFSLSMLLGFITNCAPEKGADGYSSLIKVSASASCDGFRYDVYTDYNKDGLLDNNEPVTSVTNVCHGVNGKSPSLIVRMATNECPSGGYIFSADDTETVVCHGMDGANGLTGMQGPQGEPGTSITPVKFCGSDNSTYPEYGLMVGSQLFAVYWGETPASPNKKQAFLTLLVPGTYQSTGGNNCQFTIN